jgi:hypothetical protein
MDLKKLKIGQTVIAENTNDIPGKVIEALNKAKEIKDFHSVGQFQKMLKTVQHGGRLNDSELGILGEYINWKVPDHLKLK